MSDEYRQVALLRLDAVSVLEECGVCFSCDEYGEWSVDCKQVSTERVASVLAKLIGPISKSLEWRRKRNISSLVGGPLNGQRIPLHEGVPFSNGTRIVRHLARGRWVVYVRRCDEEVARFIGEATSEKQAKRLFVAWSELPG